MNNIPFAPPTSSEVFELVKKLDRSYCKCFTGNCSVCDLRKAFGLPVEPRYTIIDDDESWGRRARAEIKRRERAMG